jgi:hypothetical protein
MAELNIYDYANIFSTYTNEEGYEFFNLMNSITIDGEIDASLYVYDVADSFTSWYELSKKYYGTPKLWWAILLANNLNNPFDVQNGQRVKVLKTTVVSNIVSQINNK